MDSAASNGQPFSILVAGRKHYIFSNLADIATIHKTKTLDIRNFLVLLYNSLFGFSKKDANSFVANKAAFHELNTKYLLTSSNNVIEASRYFSRLDEVFNALDKEIKLSATKSITQDGFVFVTDTQGTATIRAYFGQALLDLNPKILMDLTTFVAQGFWSLLSGAPGFLFPTPVTARERAVQTFKDFMKVVDKDESLTSPYLASRIRLYKEQGFGEDSASRDLNAMLFG
jgi:hypothetical protein